MFLETYHHFFLSTTDFCHWFLFYFEVIWSSIYPNAHKNKVTKIVTTYINFSKHCLQTPINLQMNCSGRFLFWFKNPTIMWSIFLILEFPWKALIFLIITMIILNYYPLCFLIIISVTLFNGYHHIIKYGSLKIATNSLIFLPSEVRVCAPLHKYGWTLQPALTKRVWRKWQTDKKLAASISSVL